MEARKLLIQHESSPSICHDGRIADKAKPIADNSSLDREKKAGVDLFSILPGVAGNDRDPSGPKHYSLANDRDHFFIFASSARSRPASYEVVLAARASSNAAFAFALAGFDIRLA